MKKANLISLVIIFVLMVACSTTKNTADSSVTAEDLSTPVTLEDRLRQKAGVFFFGPDIRIRGGDQSFFGDSEPLFIINGQAVTGGYNTAKTMVNAAEIRSITVLKNPSDLAMYGVRGANGVIKIKLKNSKG